MKIVFICGMLEPGRCGVADYTLRLAHELLNNGIRCACISIHDPYVEPYSFEACHDWDKVNLPVIRLSSRLSWSERRDLLRSAVSLLSPDWISLQYVPYSYQKKGLPYGFIRCLRSLPFAGNWHVMAHELWVNRAGSLKMRAISKLQQWIFKDIFNSLSPVVVHVSNELYRIQLKERGISALKMPIFNNIPYDQLAVPLPKAGLTWSFVVFGSIQPDWPYEHLFRRIEECRLRFGIRSCKFISVGRCGDYGERLWESFQRQRITTYPAFEFIRYGELSANRVSQELQSADFGLSMSPSLLIEKSGAIASYLAHGLPVIISNLSPNCDVWHQSLKSIGSYILMDASFSTALAAARKVPPSDRLEATASQFIADLELGR